MDSVMLTFEGQALREEIKVFFVKSRVEPYISKPMQCYDCFRFGYTKKRCTKKELCIMCGEERHEELCKAATPKCVNCGKAHKSTDYQCEVYQLQVKINIVMAYDKIAFLEAKRLVLGASSNATAPVRSKENFPTLEHKEKQSMSQIVKSSTVKDNKGLNTRKVVSYKSDISENMNEEIQKTY
uniref:Nucleic-acid-binding protein from mobile element jockey n=1 Tax=Trichogramma kaykai TaxID=54128 RepID=A0ABD2X8V1_9HYME